MRGWCAVGARSAVAPRAVERDPARDDDVARLAIEAVDRAGRPLADAEVLTIQGLRIVDDRSLAGAWHVGATTDAAGRATVDLDRDRIGSRPPEAYAAETGEVPIDGAAFVGIGVRKPGTASSLLHLVRVPRGRDAPGRAAPVRVELGGPEQVLRGRVVGPDGEPVVRALVSVDRTRLPMSLASSVETAPLLASKHSDDAGRFEVAGLSPGSHRVCVEAAGYAPHVATVGRADELVVSHDVDLRRGVTLSGRVWTPDNVPAAGAVVRLERAPELGPIDIRADAEGRFESAGIAPGRWRLAARDGRTPGRTVAQALDFRDGVTTEWEARLRARPGVHLRLVDADGAPLADWGVALVGTAEGWWTQLWTDDDGRVVAYDVRGCELVAQLMGKAGSHFAVPIRGVPVAESPDEHVLRVSDADLAAGTLTGTFVAPSATRREWNVVLRREGDGFWVPAARAVAGPFEVARVPPGRYDAAVYGRGGASRLPSFTMNAETALDFGTLALPAPGAIELESNWPTGDVQAFEILAIHERGPADVAAWRVLREPGPPTPRVELQPGRYVVDLIDERSAVSDRTDVVVTSGETQRVALGPRAAGAVGAQRPDR